MLTDIIILLVAAVIAVPIFKRLGLGAVLGYLVAGVIIGPWGIGRFNEVDELLHFAEFGVVMLLFLIGLELQPSRLWALRRSIFGFGSLQMIATGTLLGIALYLFGYAWPAALLVGLVLALSSTAFALQLMAERQELSKRWGRTAFANLLFQDLAVVPLLAIIPLLGGSDSSIEFADAAWTVGLVGGVIVAGRYVLRLMLRIAALTKVRELLTATALLTVLGMSALLAEAGFSMELGAFIAGVLLADSEFRHELEASIEPFKGLLLGLFFIAVGMSVNLGLIASQPVQIFMAAVILVGVKSLVLFALGKRTGLDTPSARRLGLTLSQGGEFAFVILGAIVAAKVISGNAADFLVVVVSVSMAMTPLLIFIDDKFSARKAPIPTYDEMPTEQQPVIIAGFGRFGQMTARVLRAKGIPFTALDVSQEQVDFVKRYGSKIYYGDASRLELLQAAGADKASLFVLAIDDVETSVRAAKMVLKHFPNLTIYARARNRNHAYLLMDLGIDIISRETFASALELTTEVLKGYGIAAATAESAVQRFRKHDEQRLHEHRELHNDEQRMQTLSRVAQEELKEMFERDVEENI
jgi:glutathione-regulated potassium-efflux system ancillary protein KefC